MARRRIPTAAGRDALRSWLRAAEDLDRSRAHDADPSGPPDGRAVGTAVRYLLEELAARAPGSSVEVRVPPFGVTQCIEGPAHSRGTPPNVVELSAESWLLLATGGISWAEAQRAGRVSASGTRADLSEVLPLVSAPGHRH